MVLPRKHPFVSEPTTVYQALIAAMADVGAVGKTDYNKQQNFAYRGIDAVMNAVSPVFQKHGIIVVPEHDVIDTTERTSNAGGALRFVQLRSKFRFYGPAGDFVEATTIGEAMDSGDKAVNKAQSIALKYALFTVLCIPTGDDPDAETHDVAPRSQSQGHYAGGNGSSGPKMISEGQVKLVQTLADKLGCSTDDAVQEFAGKKVASLDKLTMSDARKVIDGLKGHENAREDEELFNNGQP